MENKVLLYMHALLDRFRLDFGTCRCLAAQFYRLLIYRDNHLVLFRTRHKAGMMPKVDLFLVADNTTGAVRKVFAQNVRFLNRDTLLDCYGFDFSAGCRVTVEVHGPIVDQNGHMRDLRLTVAEFLALLALQLILKIHLDPSHLQI